MNKENYVLQDTLKDAFQNQYAILADCLEGVMPTFAKKLYEKKLISRPVMRSENYNSIVTEFLQGLQFLTSNESVNEHCHLFIKVLCEMEGATMNGAAQNLSKAWTEAAKKCGFDFKLPIEKIRLQQKEDTTQQICKCSLPAVLLTVKKKNKNKGRQFWKCPKGKGRQCNFFEWADECSKGSLVASSSKYSSRQCLCGLPAAERTSKQEGPNRGRLFYNCPKDKDKHQQCEYFEWGPGPRKYKRRKRSRGKRYRK